MQSHQDIFSPRQYGRYFDKMCSSNLAQPSAYFNANSGKGTKERILCSGEEVTNGRAFAFLVTGPGEGKAFELTNHGNYWFENIVANPTEQDLTITISLEDRRVSATDAKGYVTVYVGVKGLFGTTVERAGLVNGDLYCISIDGFPADNSTIGVLEKKARFSLARIPAPATDAEHAAAGCTVFGRVEDGNWAADNYNKFFFATTYFSKIWMLDFDDVSAPTTGGFVQILLDGVGNPGKWYQLDDYCA